MKRKKTFYILRYIFAVVLIIGGLGNLSSSVPFGLCVTLAGVSLFPFIWNLIRKKAAIARWIPLLVPLLFFIAAISFTPESTVQSRAIAITDEASDTPEAVVTDTPEITPAEVPTDTPTPETTPEETATPTPEPTKEAGEMKVHFLAGLMDGTRIPCHSDFCIKRQGLHLVEVGYNVFVTHFSVSPFWCYI